MSFLDRISQLKNRLRENKLGALLVSDVANVSYLTGFSNFSTNEREVFLFITSDKQYILTDGRYSQVVKREIRHFDLIELSEGRPIKKIIKNLSEIHQIQALGIEENNLTVSEYKMFHRLFKNLKHIDVRGSRVIKERGEIALIKKACMLGDRTFTYILGRIKPGVTEKQLADKIEFFIKKNGAQVSFPPIVAFGNNSSIPHHQTGNTKLGPESISGREGLFVLLDFGVKFENYCSDMTRTIFFGKPSYKQTKMYKIVLEAQKRAVDFINSSVKSGKEVKAADADKVARKYIISKDYPTLLHSLGHGIGLEVHEHPSLSPKSKEVLKEGMVFSVEPGIYIPDFGGVRIEDLYVLEKGGLRQLTTSPKGIIQV